MSLRNLQSNKTNRKINYNIINQLKLAIREAVSDLPVIDDIEYSSLPLSAPLSAPLSKLPKIKTDT